MYATSAGKARYTTLLSALDANYWIALIDIKVRRAPELDIMAQGAGKCYEERHLREYLYKPQVLEGGLQW